MAVIQAEMPLIKKKKKLRKISKKKKGTERITSAEVKFQNIFGEEDLDKGRMNTEQPLEQGLEDNKE